MTDSKSESKGNAFVELFGETLLIEKGSKTVKTEDHMKGKTHVIVYFSAHWCPPCRGFTPEFVKWYNKFIKTETGKKVEVVFESWDKDEDAFKGYFGSMPWAAIPYVKGKHALGDKFNVNGIPTVMVLDDKGEVITMKARGKIMGDPEGKAENFPWVPPPTDEISGDINNGPSLVVIYKDADALKANKEKYNEIALSFKTGKKKLLFFHALRTDESQYKQIKRIFKIDDEAQMVISDIPNKQRFCHKKSKDNSEESIKAFVTAYMNDDSDALDSKEM